MWRLTDILARGLSSWKSARGLDSLTAADAANGPDENTAGLFRRPGRKFLHVGCGQATIDDILSTGFLKSNWREIRLDADESVKPDIVGTMTEMLSVPDASVEAIYSSHGLEHLYWYDVPRALTEFRRVLADDGFLVVTCPDLQTAAQMIAKDQLFDTAYLSPAGPITPFDMVFSYRPFVQANPEWMSHHCGFTLTTLASVLSEADFAKVRGFRHESGFDLWVLASKSPRTDEEMTALAAEYLPVRGVVSPAAVDGMNAADGKTAELFRRPGRKFLHVGCGPARKPDVAPGFLSNDWQEIRLDIDPTAEPDIVCSMLDMAPAPDSSVDAVYSSHNIEHLYPHEVALALAEFFRVLKPNGFLVLACPDLQAVCRLVAENRLTEPAYVSAVGPIAPLDILYGYRPRLADGNLFMAHHTGFTLRTLEAAVRSAGFRSVAGRSGGTFLDLWIVASKTLLPEDEITRLSEAYLPHQ